MSYQKPKIYLVGGAVRDKLLGIPSKDNDYVAVGASPEYFINLGYEQVGNDFPVFLHPETREEYALARKERKTGNGYTGFSFETENVSLHDDLFRRDLTINAMAIDIETNELIDPFNGKHDLNSKTIRHVSTHFKEDPVRVLRTARFAARYNFEIHESTLNLMKDMVENGETSFLVSERVEKEFNKCLNESHPSLFFKTLHQVGLLTSLGHFSEILKETHKIDHIAQNYPNSFYRKNALYNFVFQNFSIDSLKQFKLDSQTIEQIQIYKTFKNKNLYNELTVEEKIDFIKTTKSIHNIEQGKNLIEFLHFLNGREFNEVDFFNDVQKLKSINYEELAKANPKKLKEAIAHAQVNALTPTLAIKPKF